MGARLIWYIARGGPRTPNTSSLFLHVTPPSRSGTGEGAWKTFIVTSSSVLIRSGSGAGGRSLSLVSSYGEFQSDRREGTHKLRSGTEIYWVMDVSMRAREQPNLPCLDACYTTMCQNIKAVSITE